MKRNKMRICSIALTAAMLSALPGCSNQKPAAGGNETSTQAENTPADTTTGETTSEATNAATEAATQPATEKNTESETNEAPQGSTAAENTDTGRILKLTQGMKKAAPEGAQVSQTFADSYTDLAAALAKTITEQNEAGKNFLISPLSVMTAVSMTANGAAGNTLTQMEQVLGKSLNIDEINQGLGAYYSFLEQNAPKAMAFANSLWLNEGLSMGERVREDFLKKNVDCFDAEIYKAAFDSQTLAAINRWVSDKTNTMIPTILDRLAPDSAMILLNALYFDASWEDPFYTSNTHEAEFTDADGNKQTIDMMGGSAGYYLESENYTGFMKEYKDVPFTFAALLPQEGTTVEELLQTLGSKGYSSLLSKASQESVSVRIPKLCFDAEYQLRDVLEQMGMTDAFSQVDADFSGMTGDKSLYIGKVIHKTCIEVTEGGTKAAAATAVDMRLKGVLIQKSVVLDRPFVFVILDKTYGLPLFIGAANHIN